MLGISIKNVFVDLKRLKTTAFVFRDIFYKPSTALSEGSLIYLRKYRVEVLSFRKFLKEQCPYPKVSGATM